MWLQDMLKRMCSLLIKLKKIKYHFKQSQGAFDLQILDNFMKNNFYKLYHVVGVFTNNQTSLLSGTGLSNEVVARKTLNTGTLHDLHLLEHSIP